METTEDFAVKEGRRVGFMVLDAKIVKDMGWLIGGNTIAVYTALVSFRNNQTKKAYPNIDTLAKMVALSRPTVIECLKLLDYLKVITKITESGKVTHYVLNDQKLWRTDWEPVKQELEKGDEPVKSFNTGSKAILLERLNYLTRTNTNLTNNVSKDTLQWSLEKELEKLDKSGKRYLEIIGYFIERKKLDIPNGKALAATIARYARAAKSLEGFTSSQIKKAMDDLEKRSDKDDFKWTLETVLKQLTK